MSTYDSDIKKLLQGKEKIIPVWKLTVQVEPLISVGEDIFPAAEKYPEFQHGMQSAENLTFCVQYDDSVVGTINFPGNKTQRLDIMIPDDPQETDHLLQFELLGKTDDHSYHTQDMQDVSWILKFDFWIEDLPMTSQFYHTGRLQHGPPTDIMGQNSFQTMPIKTPIYFWLLRHFDLIFRDCKDSVSKESNND